MKTSKQIPPIDKALLECLDGMFPDCAPNFKDTEKEIWIKAGQVSVVRFLKKNFDKQNETVLRSE